MPAESGSGLSSGSGAADISAAGAEFVLSLKDDASPRLAKVQEGVKGFAKTTKQHMLPLKGLMGNIFTLAGTGGLLGVGIGTAQLGLESLAESAREWITGAQAAARAQERAAEVAEHAAGVQNRMIEESVARLRELAAAGDKWAATLASPAERLGDIERRLRAARDRQAELLREFHKGEQSPAQAAAGSAAFDELGKQILEMEARRLKLLDPLTHDDDFVKRVNALRHEIATTAPALDGFRAKVEALFAGQVHNPASRLELMQLMDEAAGRDARDKIDAAAKTLGDYVKAAELAERQAGMTAHQVALMNAELAGVGGSALDDARRTLLSGGGVGQLLGMTLGTLPAIGAAVKGLAGATTRGTFAAPGAVAAQVFGGARGATDLLAAIRDGRGGLPRAIGEAVAQALVLI